MKVPLARATLTAWGTMTSPTVMSSTVGAPVDRNRAVPLVSASILGMRMPKPMTTPAARRAWTTTTRGSMGPSDPRFQRRIMV